MSAKQFEQPPAGARAMARQQQWQQTVRENLHRRLRLA